jgi:hypothetical protein
MVGKVAESVVMDPMCTAAGGAFPIGGEIVAGPQLAFLGIGR